MLSSNVALLRIPKRAERQDDEILRRTFVDFGHVLAALTSIDHQVIFGRRGTGKTHLLTVIRQQRNAAGEAAVQLDMRNLGSTSGIYGDTTIPLAQRGTRLLIDVLAAIHGRLLELAIHDPAIVDLGRLGKALDEFFDANRHVQVVGQATIETDASTTLGAERGGQFSVDIGANPSLSITGAAAASATTAQTSKTRLKGEVVHRVNFGGVGDTLRKVVDLLPNKRLWLLLDEWSEVPQELQPLLADLIRRAILPLRGVTVKIAAIEQRTRFMVPDPAIGHLGIQIGPDVSATINLDDYMVFENDEAAAIRFFRALVFSHLGAALAAEGMPPPHSESSMISECFTQINAFEEAVRACEGVPRDAIHILSHAAQKADDAKISVNDVRGAAQAWFQGSKDAAVSAHPDAKSLLVWLIDRVIKERQARAFLLEARVKDPLIDFLYDERVLHLLRKGVSAKDSPGTRFNIFGIDYGCYVDLINTARAPRGLLDAGAGDLAEFLPAVPKTDLRSIRRCILDLSTFYDSQRSA
jgi:hypothetical protein